MSAVAPPAGEVAVEAGQRVRPLGPGRVLRRLDRYLRNRGATGETRQALRRAYGEWLIATAGEVR